VTTRRTLLAPAVLPALLLAALAPAPLASSASAATTRAATTSTVSLDGVTVRLAPGTSQVVTVNHTRGYHARVSLWRNLSSGWQLVKRARDGRIGYGGLVVGTKREQGTGTTPLGTYRLLGSFGTHPKAAAWDLRYRRIRSGDYWVEDNKSDYYNRYRNKSQGGFRWWLESGPNTSERLQDYPTQYEFAINTSFNRGQVRYRGAGIFLHVNGRGATAGCVSAPRWFMRAMMNRLDPARVPQIAIGR
jgi:L,D-peptidoglycan transpeptidase YkuD (ErfK/YbiS/YcfS/YnhG family)